MVKQNPELLPSLRQLGLNEYQAKVYIALSVLGQSTAGGIADKSKVPRARAYDVLEELCSKGFAAVKSGRPVEYSSLPISEAVKTLKRLKESDTRDELLKMDSLGASLQELMKTASVRNEFSAEENVWTLKGRDAIYSKMASMIAGAKSHVVLSSSPEGVCRKMLTHQSEFEKAGKRGVKMHLVSQIPKDHRAWKTCGNAINLMQLHEKTLPTRMMLSDDQALIFLTHESVPAEEEVGVWINSPHLVSTLKESVPALAMPRR